MSERLSIDWTACDGRGLCSDLLPELLEEDPWGYPKPVSGIPGGPGHALVDVPAALGDPARRAVHLCPRLALRLQTRPFPRDHAVVVPRGEPQLHDHEERGWVS